MNAELMFCGHEKRFMLDFGPSKSGTGIELPETWKCAICAVMEATANEQNRCMNVALDQYGYWRSCDIQGIQDFASGALGASANIVCSICGLMPTMKREDVPKK